MQDTLRSKCQSLRGATKGPLTGKGGIKGKTTARMQDGTRHD